MNLKDRGQLKLQEPIKLIAIIKIVFREIYFQSIL
jgi:hypothetical protein